MTSIKGVLHYMLNWSTGVSLMTSSNGICWDGRNLQLAQFQLIEDLLDRTRIQTGKSLSCSAELDLGLCVAEVVEQLRPLAHAKRQTLERLYPDVPLLVWADRDRLVQIVINLVQNAMKFTPEEGGITVTVGKENHRHAGAAVRDTGPGIPPERLERSLILFSESRRRGRPPKGSASGYQSFERSWSCTEAR